MYALDHDDLTLSEVSLFSRDLGCSGDVNFKMCVTLLCGVVAVFLAQFIVTVIGEFCSILEIEVFTTKEEVAKRIEREKLKQELRDRTKKKTVQLNARSQSEEKKPVRRMGMVTRRLFRQQAQEFSN